MTEQPPATAAPTPGKWEIRGDPKDGQPPDIVAETGRGPFRLEIIARTFANVPKFNGTLEELWANALLLATAKETAAERDRLLVVNEKLAEALEKMMAGINAMRYGDIPPLNEWQEVWDETRAALAEARKL